MLKDDALLERVEANYEEAGLEPHRLQMLRYVDKLTVAPWTVTRADVEDLRTAGYSDTDVLAIAEVASYYAYVNRIADGLGVELE